MFGDTCFSYLQPLQNYSFLFLLGIEALREVRRIVFDSKCVYVEIPMSGDGECLAQKDVYGRYLLNVIVESAEGEKCNLGVLLASSGFTMSYYADGIRRDLDQAMRESIRERRGIFNLPDEVFAYPFR